jgi:hypothetical protein
VAKIALLYLLFKSSNLICCIASPVRRALTFFLDEKSKQKNQDAPNSLNAQTVERRKGALGLGFFSVAKVRVSQFTRASGL